MRRLQRRAFKHLHFLSTQQSPFARAHRAERERTDAKAPKMNDLVSEIVKHEADLAFDALPQHDLERTRPNDSELLDFRSPAFDAKPAQKFFPMARIERFIQTDFIFLFNMVTRMCQGERELAVVRHDEETVAFFIESADMKESGPIFWQEVENRAAFALVLRGAEESARFEKNRVNRRLFSHNARSDFYGIAGIDLGGQVADHAPIDAYCPL